MRKGSRVAAMVVAAGMLLSAPVRADQIALTAGVLDVLVSPSGSAAGGVQLAGDRGFTWVGPMTAGFGPPIGDPLVPGTTVTLHGSASGLELGGTVTLDGVTYTGIGGLDSSAGASLRMATTVTLPSVLSSPSSVIGPFMLDLVFWGQERHSLFGSGTATIFLDEDRGFGVPSWLVTRFRAELSSAPAPVPEPATLLLAGAGLAWVARRRRRTWRGD